MADQKRTRSLSYRRAVWFKPSSEDLQTLVKAALDKFTTCDATQIDRGDQVVEIRHRIKSDSTSAAGPVTLIHVASYTPKDAASTVPLTPGLENADLSSMPARVGEEFLDGNVMALLKGNDICLCPSNFHESGLQNYLIKLLKMAGYDEETLGFEIQKVANRENLQKLVSGGVKEITFDLSAYVHSIDEASQTPAKKLGSYLGALFTKDTSVEELMEKEGLQSYVTLKADGRLAHGAAQGALAEFAVDVIEEETEGFVIETKGGDRITPSELSVRRRVMIERDAKTVKHSEAWQKLKDFYEYIDAQKLNQF